MDHNTKVQTLISQAKAGEIDMDTLAGELSTLQRQVDAQAEMIRSLKRDTITDSLTGALNRRGFEAELNKAMANARRHNRLSALLFVDMDNFKHINDTYGHHAGDEALCHVADLLQANIRETDVLARVGGDEFSIILNDVRSVADAEKRAELLSHFISSSPVRFDEERIEVKASVGTQSFSAQDDMIEVIARADEAMYAAKKSRRSVGNSCPFTVKIP